MTRVRVTELFSSIQGESHWAGYPCTFIRLTGCNLDCAYCDTRYARYGGQELAVSAVVDAARNAGLAMVEVTGGEPLCQPAAPDLLEALCREGFRVLLETNGSLPLEPVPPAVCVVMDLKTPGSGMGDRTRWENLSVLKPTDEVKFVLRDRGDYEWARNVLSERALIGRHRVSLSPVSGELDPAVLAAWMIEDRLDARFQIQLHRILWPDRDRGV